MRKREKDKWEFIDEKLVYVRRTSLDRLNFLKKFLGVPTLYTAYNSSLLSEFISDSLPFICVHWQKYWLARPTGFVPSSVPIGPAYERSV
jgi:hypothetical protein